MFKKYLKIYKVIVTNSISFEAQYRRDTWLKLVVNFLWLGLTFATIEALFSQTSAIAGWSKPEIYLMSMLWIIADEIFAILFCSNLTSLPFLITDGDLDFILTKPVNTLFLISTKIFLMRGFFRLLMEIVILSWLMWKFDFAASYLHALLAFFMMIVAVVVDYSRTLIANTLSFWYYRIDNINEAISSFHTIGKYPLSIWPKTLKIILLTALPVVYTGFIPTATLTGRWPWYGIFGAFAFSLLLLVSAVKFWYFAIQYYSSASS